MGEHKTFVVSFVRSTQVHCVVVADVEVCWNVAVHTAYFAPTVTPGTDYADIMLSIRTLCQKVSVSHPHVLWCMTHWSVPVQIRQSALHFVADQLPLLCYHGFKFRSETSCPNWHSSWVSLATPQNFPETASNQATMALFTRRCVTNCW